jgi:TetR/AcrR family transcriptional repressor of nem operon
LAVAAIDAGWEFKKPEYDAIFSAQNPPLERLSRWCTRSILDQREKLVHYGRVCGCPVATMGSEMANQDEILRAKCEELMARALRYLESAIRDAKAEGLIAVDDVPSAALQVHCLYLGQMIQARVRNDLSLLEHLEDSVFRFLGASHPVKA